MYLLSCMTALTLLLGIGSSTMIYAQEPAPGTPMNQAELHAIIQAYAGNGQAESGMLQFTYKGRQLLCISDPDHDRMRIVAPIADAKLLNEEIKDALLEANYHSALDARYGITQGTLCAAFVHPLSPLDQAQIESAVRQVANLAETFGTTYTSGELSFGSADGGDDPEENK